MINESMYALGAAPSAIRQLFAYGLGRKAEIGADKVFDFSLGNPSVPAPPEIAEAIRELSEMPADKLHGYTPSQGSASTRAIIADDLNERFGGGYSADDLYLTMGAAASLDICINALTVPGDEIIVIAPYFPEYRMWIEAAGVRCVQVNARESDFQIDAPAVAAAITERTRAVIVNSPNNPVGTVFSRENLAELAEVLSVASEANGEPIYIISDEPYRELNYTGEPTPWVPSIYANTLVCYSWSKSLSLPGERIGYVLVGPDVTDSRRVYLAVCGAGRALGYICAPTLFQAVIERCIKAPVDVEAYVVNRKTLTEGLSELGYEFIEPQGAFYLWVKALEPDAQAFADRAKAHELLLVPSDSFGVGGWVRIGYCVAHDVIVNSMPAFKALMEEYR